MTRSDSGFGATKLRRGRTAAPWWVKGVAVLCLFGLLGAAPGEDQFKIRSDGQGAADMPLIPGRLGTSEPPQLPEAPTMRISMEFDEARLKDVLKAFSQQTGINVIASEQVSNQTVTLYLEDVTVMDALNQMLDVSNLKYERPAGSQIYVVKPRLPGDAVVATIETVTRVYRLRYARVSASRLALAAAALAEYVPADSTEAFAGGSVGIASEEVGIDQIIEGLLTDVGKVEVDVRTNSIIVTDVEENFPRIESVLAVLDVRTAQVLIESELLEISLATLRDLGLEWGTGTEADFVDFRLGTRTTRFPFGLFGRVAPSASTAFSTSTLDASDAIGILQALHRNTETKVLARPKILTLDNERAIIQLTTDQAIGFQSTTGETSGLSTSQPERTTTGIILVVTPQINEGGFVTMLVEPSVTKVVAAQVTPPTASGSVVDPKTRSARTLVRIRDGDSLVIGGLIDRDEEEIVRRVPILSRIPLLGEMFTNREVSRTESELIVFVTPHIVQEAGASQVAVADYGISQPIREQGPVSARQDLIEDALERLIPLPSEGGPVEVKASELEE